MLPEEGVTRRVPIVPEEVVVGTADAAGPKLIRPPGVISGVDFALSPLSSWQKTFPRSKDNSRRRLDRPKMVRERRAGAEVQKGIVHCGKQRN